MKDQERLPSLFGGFIDAWVLFIELEAARYFLGGHGRDPLPLARLVLLAGFRPEEQPRHGLPVPPVKLGASRQFRTNDVIVVGCVWGATNRGVLIVFAGENHKDCLNEKGSAEN
jgi:hypothetical protein